MSTLNHIFVFGLAIGLVPSIANAQRRKKPAKAMEEVTMFIGEQKVISGRNISSYSESVPGVVRVKIPSDGSRMVITAVNSGQTSLLLIRRDSTEKTMVISVMGRPPESVKRELDEILGDIPSINIRQVGPRIVLEGGVPNERLLEKVALLDGLYGPQVVSLVVLDPRKVLKKINIKLDVHFVEFSVREGYQFGVSWPSQFLGADQTLNMTFDLQSGSTSAATYAISTNSLPALDLLSFWGWAKILKQGSVMTTNGTQASYRTGGEINIPVSGNAGGSLQQIPFGSNVTVTPFFDEESGRIDLMIQAEASELGDAIDNVPSRSVSNIQTVVHLEMGQSVMLLGIKSRTAREVRSGWPILRHIPILGYVFRTDAFNESDTEGAIFITPTVIHQVRDTDRQRLQQLIKKYEVWEG